MQDASKPVTLGVIVGNRGFFPGELADSGREEILRALAAEGIRVIAASPEQTPHGAVENYHDAQQLAAQFRAHRDEIDGILVTLPNFGDERAVADTIRLAQLRQPTPVLVHAFPDELNRMDIRHRRDSFCGKLSVCNNLGQYRIPFTLTQLHTESPDSDAFRQDLRSFVATCRVVRGLRPSSGFRIGAIGARPANFNTVRYSEKILEAAGITVVPLDLGEILGQVERVGEDEPAVQQKLGQIRAYVNVGDVPDAALLKMARLGAVIDRWMQAEGLQATAVQCWTALEQYYGVVPCALMSMMSDRLLPSACEVDVTGAVAMYALALASGSPSAIVDWNNNYGDDPDRAVIFHCSNLPRSLFAECRLGYQAIIAGTVGQENAYGTVEGRLRATPVTFARVATDDAAGRLRAYLGTGELTDDPLTTFGGYAVIHIERLQALLHFIARSGFEHHVAINPGRWQGAVAEALGRYLGWDVYEHNREHRPSSGCEER